MADSGSRTGFVLGGDCFDLSLVMPGVQGGGVGRTRKLKSCSLRSMERQAISFSWPLGLFQSHCLHITLAHGYFLGLRLVAEKANSYHLSRDLRAFSVMTFQGPSYLQFLFVCYLWSVPLRYRHQVLKQ